MKSIEYTHYGGSINISLLKKLLQSTYAKKNKQENIDDYILDHELSGQRVEVRYNNSNNHAIVAHRGTQGIYDWLTNLRYGLLNDKSGKRFKHSKKIQKLAEQKYANAKITTIGHSQGALHAQNASKGDVITLNKPTALHDIGKTVPKNQVDIKTRYDPVSILKPLEIDNGKSIVVGSTSHDPLKEHSTDTLNRLDGNMIVGGALSGYMRLLVGPVEQAREALNSRLNDLYQDGSHIMPIEHYNEIKNAMTSIDNNLRHLLQPFLGNNEPILSRADDRIFRTLLKDLGKRYIDVLNELNITYNPSSDATSREIRGYGLKRKKPPVIIKTPKEIMAQKLLELNQRSDPEKAQLRAKVVLGKNAILYVSETKTKKYKVLNPNTNKFVHFGQIDYDDFLKHGDETRRKAFLSRNEKWGKQEKYTPGYLAYHILW